MRFSLCSLILFSFDGFRWKIASMKLQSLQFLITRLIEMEKGWRDVNWLIKLTRSIEIVAFSRRSGVAWREFVIHNDLEVRMLYVCTNFHKIAFPSLISISTAKTSNWLQSIFLKTQAGNENWDEERHRLVHCRWIILD